ncbi:hypothetical protein HELRODRAFT_179670 [Helobdella robusta]|uniref:PID domain-containing protein n=1 Tax=Helobdella robusta TaxID=6412 RepID=T1FF04_HELRO|nr:hypothetical protein HELRODRAFT_179670 [Helobdella robusta]ESN95085.1 hypothetical protein HELRODRAFT_179670 [Helobdella robusta]
MEMIRRIISSGSVASGFSSRRQNNDNKLEESPPDYKDPDKVASGISFRVRYFGSTLVEELTEEGASYGDSITTKAITAIITFAFASGHKIKKVELKVSVKGIMVTDAQTHRCISNLDIHRLATLKMILIISYGLNRFNEETFKQSQTITLTIASSFKLAQEMQNNEHEKPSDSTTSDNINNIAKNTIINGIINSEQQQ